MAHPPVYPLSVAAIDLGATSGRVIVGTLSHGEGVALNDVHRFKTGFATLAGHDYWDLGRLFQEISHGLQEAKKLYPSLASCGVDTWGVDHALVDADGRLVFPVHAYRDDRTAPFVKREQDRDGGRHLHDRTGLPLLAFNTVFQLSETVSRYPAVRELASRVLLLPDYFNFLLSGRFVNELSIASTTQLLDVQTGTWAPDLLADYGLPASWFSPPTAAGARLGPVTGVPGLGDVENILVPGHDTACAFDALPDADGALIVSAGTWILAGAFLERPALGDEAFTARFCNERAGDGRFRPNNNLLGLWLLERLLASFTSRPDSDAAWNALIEAAEAIPAPTELIDTTDADLFNPNDMRAAIDAQLVRRGLPPPSSLAGYVRLICESLARSIADARARFIRVAGQPLDRILLVGGGARNRLLAQRTADLARVPVTALQVEGTALGNLAHQFVALGALPDLTAFHALISPSLPRRVFTPRA